MMMNYFEVPPPQEIKEFLKKIGITSATVAKITGVDSSSARRWVMDENNKSYSKMPLPVWLLLNLLFSENSESIARDIRRNTKYKNEQEMIFSFGQYIKNEMMVYNGTEWIKKILKNKFSKFKEDGIPAARWGEILFSPENKQKLFDEIKSTIKCNQLKTFNVLRIKNPEYEELEQPWNLKLEQRRLEANDYHSTPWLFHEIANSIMHPHLQFTMRLQAVINYTTRLKAGMFRKYGDEVFVKPYMKEPKFIAAVQKEYDKVLKGINEKLIENLKNLD